jgi:hypothetical protein
MQNVGALRMLEECSTRHHLELWSLGLPYLEDVSCIGMVRKLLKHFEHMFEEAVQPNDIAFICPLSACSHAG